MAILQLSRITHRKGLDEDLPQLAGAELGWVLDNRRLFIGNGTIVEGAPVVGNTEILTEHSDLLGLASTYTYKGSDAGYVVETGADDTTILRSMQSKFDDFASVKDFGAVGDGVTDDTDAINRALYQLFCHNLAGDLTLNSKNNPSARRSLYFPAGTYKVTGKIKVPPHAKMFGEGLTSSIIAFMLAADEAITEIVDGERYQVSDLGTTTEAQWQALGTYPAAPATPAFPAIDEVFIAIQNGTGAIGTGTVRPSPAVVETADSLQQSGLQLGTNDAQLPTGIEMISMGISSTEPNSLLKLNSVTSSGFAYIGLNGAITDVADIQVIGEETAAVEITGSVHDVTISKLNTQGTTYGLKASGDTKGVVLENSGLDLHYKGVYVTNDLIQAPNMITGVRYKIVSVGTSDFTIASAEFNREGVTFVHDGDLVTGDGTVISMDDPSPTGIVVSRNIFDNIAFEGVHYENVLFNSTGYNVFYNVANDFSGSGVVPVVKFETDQCISVGDLFEREEETAAAPRIMLAGNGGISIDGSHSIHLGSYERQVGLEAALDNSTSDTLISNVTAEPNSYKVDYNITNGSDATRMGTMTVSVYNGVITFDDEYTETGTLDITLNAVAGASSNSTLEYTSASLNDAVINFSVVRLD